MVYDCVWYWVGGSERGEWARAIPDRLAHQMSPRRREQLREMISEIERGGRVAVMGSTRIGPPEGPPDAERMDDLVRYSIREGLEGRVGLEPERSE